MSPEATPPTPIPPPAKSRWPDVRFFLLFVALGVVIYQNVQLSNALHDARVAQDASMTMRLDRLESKLDQTHSKVDTNYRNFQVVLDEIGKVRRGVGQ